MKKFILIIGSVLFLASSSVYALAPGSSDNMIEIVPIFVSAGSTSSDDALFAVNVKVVPKYGAILNLAKKVNENAGLIASCTITDNTTVTCGNKKITNNDAGLFLPMLKNQSIWTQILSNNKNLLAAANNARLSDFVPGSLEMGSSRTVKLTKLTRAQLDAINRAASALNALVGTLGSVDFDVLCFFANDILGGQSN